MIKSVINIVILVMLFANVHHVNAINDESKRNIEIDSMQTILEIGLKSLVYRNLIKENKLDILVSCTFDTKNDWQFAGFIHKNISFKNASNYSNAKVDILFKNLIINQNDIKLIFKSFGSGGEEYFGSITIVHETNQFKFKEINFITGIE